MPIMQVIEAQRTSILVPHDHLHNNQMSEFQADETFSSALIDEVVMMLFWQDGGGAGGPW
jgi:hypothetical protein